MDRDAHVAWLRSRLSTDFDDEVTQLGATPTAGKARIVRPVQLVPTDHVERVDATLLGAGAGIRSPSPRTVQHDAFADPKAAAFDVSPTLAGRQ